MNNKTKPSVSFRASNIGPANKNSHVHRTGRGAGGGLGGGWIVASTPPSFLMQFMQAVKNPLSIFTRSESSSYSARKRPGPGEL